MGIITEVSRVVGALVAVGLEGRAAGSNRGTQHLDLLIINLGVVGSSPTGLTNYRRRRSTAGPITIAMNLTSEAPYTWLLSTCGLAVGATCVPAPDRVRRLAPSAISTFACLSWGICSCIDLGPRVRCVS
jgi:hypothetical protein